MDLRLAIHQAMAIVFQLEYAFSAPIGQELMVRVLSTDGAQSLMFVVNTSARLKSALNCDDLEIILNFEPS